MLSPLIETPASAFGWRCAGGTRKGLCVPFPPSRNELISPSKGSCWLCLLSWHFGTQKFGVKAARSCISELLAVADVPVLVLAPCVSGRSWTQESWISTSTQRSVPTPAGAPKLT